MDSPWRAYLPEFLVEDLDDDGRTLEPGAASRFPAAVLFLDIAGFTPLSEALGLLGRAGTEQLGTVLNDYFAPTVERIRTYGGSVAAFAGDAVTVLFRGDPHDATQRAAACALAIQAQADRFSQVETAAGTFTLAVKAGLAVGEVLSLIVGTSERRAHVVAGRPLDDSAAAEHHGTPGEVVLAPSAQPYLPARVLGRPRDAFRPIVGAIDREPTPPDPRTRTPQVLDRVGPTFLHPAIARRVADDLVGFVLEHRKVTTLFVEFGEVDTDDPGTPGRLTAYLADVAAVIARYDGHLRQVALGDKGSLCIAVFGAPVAHDDDESRALACALDLLADARRDVRIGITTGRVFCGHVGSPERREYAVMGDAVNLSARLMQAARARTVLVDGATRQAVGERFAFADPTRIQVKGKDQPVEVATLLGQARRSGEPAPARPARLVGRDTELDRARGLLEAAAAGHGGVLGVRGDPGVGKSALVAEIAEIAAGAGFAVHGGAFESFRTAGYLGWRDAWWGLLGLEDVRGTDAAASSLVSAVTDIAPALANQAPLLGDVLGLAVPESDTTRDLEPADRAAMIRALLTEVLASRAGETPRLVVLEDVHWQDGPSAALLDHLAARVEPMPVLFAVTYRPEDRAGAPLRPAVDHELELVDLDERALAELVRSRTQERTGQVPAPELVAAVVERCGGNPLFAEQLLDLLVSQGVDPSDPDAADRLEVPDTLGSVVLARLDRLPDQQQTIVKLASVLGRSFAAPWVWGSFPQAGPRESVLEGLDALASVGLVPLEAREPERVYAFQHAVIRDVAYETLAIANRETLHESAGTHLETVLDAEADADLLAHHFGRSRNVDKQRVWFERAADHAKGAYANDSAIDWYDRLLPLLTGAERADPLCRYGGVLELIGRWDDAASAYQQAIDVGRGSARTAARAALGVLRSYVGTTDEAVDLLEEAADEAARSDDRAGERQALEYLAWVHWSASEWDRALRAARRQLELARADDDPTAIGSALKNLGDVAWGTGHLGLAREHLEQAAALGRDHDDLPLAVHASAALVGVLAQLDDHRAAADALAETRELATRIGYRHVAVGTDGNEAELRRLEGDHAGAVTYAVSALRGSDELGDTSYVLAVWLGTLAAIVSRIAAPAADRLFALALEFGRPLEHPALAETLLLAGEHALRAGDLARAREHVADALERSSGTGNGPIEFRARVLAGRLDVALHTRATTDVLAELDGLWAADLAPWQHAALQYERWRLDASREQDRELAAATYRRLHVDAPKLEYRERHEELTGVTPSDPPSLPALDVSPADLNLEDVLEQAEAIVHRARRSLGSPDA